MVTSTEVSDAALNKRNLKRSSAHKICKRGYGANDPENIAIVNMKESDEMSFEEIRDALNKKRIDSGKAPSLSICGVTGRYNRTAPLLYASQGREFIPLSQRGGRGMSNGGGPNGKFVWNNETDVILVDCVKQIEAQKWFMVAKLFTEKTGTKVDAESCAMRHTIL